LLKSKPTAEAVELVRFRFSPSSAEVAELVLFHS